MVETAHAIDTCMTPKALAFYKKNKTHFLQEKNCQGPEGTNGLYFACLVSSGSSLTPVHGLGPHFSPAWGCQNLPQWHHRTLVSSSLQPCPVYQWVLQHQAHLQANIPALLQPVPIAREVPSSHSWGCAWLTVFKAGVDGWLGGPLLPGQAMLLPRRPLPKKSYWLSLLPDNNIFPGIFFMATNGRQTILSRT